MERIIEFLFNAEKYRKMKMALTFIYILAFFIVNVNHLATTYQMYLFLFIIVILLFANKLLKIVWYNRKMKVATSKREWIEVSVIAILFVIILFKYVQL